MRNSLYGSILGRTESSRCSRPLRSVVSIYKAVPESHPRIHSNITHASRWSRGKGRSRSDKSKGASSGELHGYDELRDWNVTILCLLRMASRSSIRTPQKRFISGSFLQGQLEVVSFVFYGELIGRFRSVLVICTGRRNFSFSNHISIMFTWRAINLSTVSKIFARHLSYRRR